MDERVYARYMSDLAYFMNLLETRPTSKYHLPVALAYIKLEKYAECVEVCKEALSRFPTHCPTKTLLAEAYINLGDIISARDLLNDVVAEDEGNYKALKLLGIVMQAEELSDRAIRYFRLAYFRVPEDTSLIKMITDLGGGIDLDDILKEQSKRVGAKETELDEETKTYNEINQSIKNAELMMQDLFSDSSISSEQTPDTAGRLDELIDETMQKGYNSDLMAKTDSKPFEEVLQEEIKNNEQPLDDNLVSDDELERLLAGNDNDSSSDENIVTETLADEVDVVTETVTDIEADDNTTAPLDLASELANIEFDDIDDLLEDEEKEDDSVTTDLANELNNIKFDDLEDEVEIDNKKQPLELVEGEVNLYGLPLDDVYDDASLVGHNNSFDNIQTSDLINQIDTLISDTESELMDQIDPNLDLVKKEYRAYNDIDETELVEEDSEDNNASIMADDIVVNIAHEQELVSRGKDDIKKLEKYPQLTLEQLLTDDNSFFSTDEYDSGPKIEAEDMSAPFYQADIYDEILEKSNLTIDDILSSGPPSKAGSDRVQSIKRLQKKLIQVKAMQDERLQEKFSKEADRNKKVKV